MVLFSHFIVKDLAARKVNAFLMKWVKMVIRYKSDICSLTRFFESVEKYYENKSSHSIKTQNISSFFFMWLHSRNPHTWNLAYLANNVLTWAFSHILNILWEQPFFFSSCTLLIIIYLMNSPLLDRQVSFHTSLL